MLVFCYKLTRFTGQQFFRSHVNSYVLPVFNFGFGLEAAMLAFVTPLLWHFFDEIWFLSGGIGHSGSFSSLATSDGCRSVQGRGRFWRLVLSPRFSRVNEPAPSGPSAPLVPLTVRRRRRLIRERARGLCTPTRLARRGYTGEKEKKEEEDEDEEDEDEEDE